MSVCGKISGSGKETRTSVGLVLLTAWWWVGPEINSGKKGITAEHLQLGDKNISQTENIYLVTAELLTLHTTFKNFRTPVL